MKEIELPVPGLPDKKKEKGELLSMELDKCSQTSENSVSRQTKDVDSDSLRSSNALCAKNIP
jgi:hypothetical protein